jgi:hypothetical protein
LDCLAGVFQFLAAVVDALVDANVVLLAERSLDREGHLVEIDCRDVDVFR